MVTLKDIPNYKKPPVVFFSQGLVVTHATWNLLRMSDCGKRTETILTRYSDILVPVIPNIAHQAPGS